MAAAVPPASAASTRPPPTDAAAARKARSKATRRPALVTSTFGISLWSRTRPATGRAGLPPGAEEERHGGVTGSADTAPPHHRDHGPPEDVEVQTEACMIDVPDVEGELLLPGDRVPAPYLREPGDPREHLVTPRLLERIALE